MSRILERIENYNRAFTLYSSMHCEYTNVHSDMSRLALTQSYEIVIELGWKVLKDYLNDNGIRVSSPLDTVKEAFSFDIDINGQIWIDMIKDRNISSHEYNMDKLDIIVEKINTTYYEELLKFRNPYVEMVKIYGSRAKGNYRNGSDIDFALWLKEGGRASVIKYDLYILPTPYKFDVTDYKNLTHEGMKKSIDTDGKLFYKKEN